MLKVLLHKFKMIKIKDKVIISDPCYSLDTWCMTSQDNMLSGNYNYYIEESDEKDWGIRVKSIEIVHEKYKRPKRWKFKNSLVGVDSGQAGIFCSSIYPTLEEENGEYGDLDSFYGKCCDLTMQNYDELELYSKLLEDIKNKESKIFYGNLSSLEWNYNYYKEHVECLESFEKYLEYTKNRYDSMPIHLKEKTSWQDYQDKLKESYDSNIESQYYHKRYNIYKEYIETNIVPEKPKLIQYGIIDNKGIVSRSGFGDGQYSCYANFNSVGKCIGVKIRFI